MDRGAWRLQSIGSQTVGTQLSDKRTHTQGKEKQDPLFIMRENQKKWQYKKHLKLPYLCIVYHFIFPNL